MGPLVYALCAVAALLCAVLLLHAYVKGGHRLLFWSGLCFVGLTINNTFLVIDKIILPGTDLSTIRTSFALIGMLVLLYGLVWEQE
jgi:hydrogenase/urease accessory protein HupE